MICPEQVPLLQEARKRQRSLLARNFVDRESERPALTLNDFIPLQMLVPPSDVDAEKLQRKRKRKSRYPLFKLPFIFPLILNLHIYLMPAWLELFFQKTVLAGHLVFEIESCFIPLFLTPIHCMKRHLQGREVQKTWKGD